ncbi:uncharacterized protein FOMMEDRAFT_22103 [Fomitiporia mediterranea MF3/22]|uniref:uncharacterized protein n=1 Tax=Fomitiporia mediterranea (strain MF3/22) TaxID=694068 RepID=UPI00044090FB|nr:uncharacterized protein FOMMEDRAFT_22103 [Fomitiporia mediterranea MF3/22]EJD01758.1 hypothetical protein FOMMEDRAFT_22103 [Fomitiporia mediterranea MF3/22]
MDMQTSRAHFALDSASASVLSAWENSQRHPPAHRQPFAYNGYPLSPVSPSSSPPSTSSSLQMATSNPWTPPPVSEMEIMQLRRGLQVHIPATGPVAEHEPRMTANQPGAPFNFDFDFSLPHLSLPPPSFSQHLSQHQQQQHQQQRCSPPLPTPTSPTSSSELFSSPPAHNMSFRRESSPSSLKRSASDDRSDTSAAASPVSNNNNNTKKRACMSLKDFVPPDVTGLSKREARLVKNRAAAFLSRQRKREEFELMEIRVAELERENSRLRELADGQTPSTPSLSSESSELELLRMQLASARQREIELVHRLEVLKHEQKVKTEASEPVLSDGTNSDAGANSPLMAPASLKNIVANPKGGASLGLMVLLCALPSLLSHPSSHPRSTLPTSQSFLDTIQWDGPSFFPTATSGTATAEDVPSWELDFSGVSSGNMAMDVDYTNAQDANEGDEWKKLELGLDGAEDMGLSGLGLGALDVSFSTRKTKDGKIRVRVHSPPSASSQTPASLESVSQMKMEQSTPTVDDLVDPSSLMSFSLPSPANSQSSPSTSVSSPHEGPNPLSLSYVDADPLGPFLGAGASPTAAFDLGSPFDFSSSSSGLIGGQSGERRRVRIALRSLPQPGGEGGEWEVEVR